MKVDLQGIELYFCMDSYNLEEVGRIIFLNQKKLSTWLNRKKKIYIYIYIFLNKANSAHLKTNICRLFVTDKT